MENGNEEHKKIKSIIKKIKKNSLCYLGSGVETSDLSCILKNIINT
jgi:hypothetical protein